MVVKWQTCKLCYSLRLRLPNRYTLLSKSDSDSEAEPDSDTEPGPGGQRYPYLAPRWSTALDGGCVPPDYTVPNEVGE